MAVLAWWIAITGVPGRSRRWWRRTGTECGAPSLNKLSDAEGPMMQRAEHVCATRPAASPDFRPLAHPHSTLGAVPRGGRFKPAAMGAAGLALEDEICDLEIGRSETLLWVSGCSP